MEWLFCYVLFSQRAHYIHSKTRTNGKETTENRLKEARFQCFPLFSCLVIVALVNSNVHRSKNGGLVQIFQEKIHFVHKPTKSVLNDDQFR